MSDDANTLLKHQEQLASKRTNWNSWWQDLADRVLPSQAQFTVTSEEGERRNERIFDGRAITANDRFAAVMEDLLTPRTQKWHLLAPEDDDLEDNHEVQVWYEEVNRILFTQRYRPSANFASQKHQGYMSVGAFGNSCMFIDERVGEGARYRHLHLKEVFWAENRDGIVDMLYRLYPMHLRDAVKRFGNKLPEKVRSKAEKEPFANYDILHCVRPNEERKPGRADFTGMPWSSFYVDVKEKAVMEAGGFTSWPFSIGRYMMGPGEVYARSPAMACWGSILTLNEEKKTILRAGQKEVDPPILLHEDGALDAFNIKSGALNYGMVTNDGSPLAMPFRGGGNIPLGLELMNLERQDIDDAFLVTVFQILLENSQLTATQVLEIAQQKGMLMAPIMGRQHSEDLGPLINRELDIASKAGLLPPMPEALRERGANYKIEYRSPLARAMRAQDGVAISRTLEMIPIASQIDPRAAYVVDAAESMRELAEIHGMPAKLLRSRETVQELIEDEQEQEAAEQALAAAPAISESALKATQANQIRAETGL